MDILLTLSQREKSSIGVAISKTNASNLYPRLDETSLVKELVAQFLAHDGYVETAKAFRAEVQSEANALRSAPSLSPDKFATEEDVDAVNRQRTFPSPSYHPRNLGMLILVRHTCRHPRGRH